MRYRKIYIAVFMVLLLLLSYRFITDVGNDEKNNSQVVCRVNGCGETPVYLNWEDRFCSEHLDKSENHFNQYDSSTAKKKVNTKPALTKEEAEILRGTGYHGTRPNSPAEDIEIKAAMVKCKNCGMHSDNGSNSLCDECQYNKGYGFD